MRKNYFNRGIALALTSVMAFSGGPNLGTVFVYGEGTNTAAEVAVQVNTKEELREISRSMFGVNHRYGNDAYGTWNTEKKEVWEEFDAYYTQSKFGSMRYPGGTISNLYDWKRGIGEVSTRKKQIHGLPYESNPPQIAYFGLDEVAAYCNKTNTELVYVYALGHGSAADAADLVEYLNSPNDGSNPNGGIDWAAIRAKNGHPAPYNVKHFEMGNEMNQYRQDYWMSGFQSAKQTKVEAYIFGGEMKITTANQEDMYRGLVRDEDWRPSASKSDGTANQELYIRYSPVVAESETILVGTETWSRVGELSTQAADAKVYTIDNSTGKITFGDGVHGAIPTKDQRITAEYTTIQDGFIKMYESMKAVDPTIKIYSSYEDNNFINRMKQADAGNKYDGLSIHPYTQSGGAVPNDDPLFYEKIMEIGDKKVFDAVQNKVNLMNQGVTDKALQKVPVISEFGIYNHQADIIKSQTHGLFIARAMFNFINQGSPYINKHCLVDFLSGSGDSLGPSAQAVIQAYKNKDGSIDYVPTPSAKVFEILNNMTGNKQISNTIGEQPFLYNQVKLLSALTSKDDAGNLYAAMVNLQKKNDETLPVNVTFSDTDLTNRFIEVWTVAGDNFDSLNTQSHRNNVIVEKKVIKSDSATLKYNLAAHSLTAFKVLPAGATSNLVAVTKSAVDKEALQWKIRQVEKKDSALYTTTTWSSLDEKKTAAKNIMDNAQATQEQVDEVYGQLMTALSGLEEKGPEGTEKIPSAGMTATAGSAQSQAQGADKVLDGKNDTLWHTSWDGAQRDLHYITINLGKEYKINMLNYLPRTSGTNGIIKGYEIYTSLNGTDFTKVSEGQWESNSDLKKAVFPLTNAQYVKLVSVTSMSDAANKEFTSAAEISIYGKDKDAKPEPEVIPVSSIRVNPEMLELEPGKTQLLTATVLPDNATSKVVTWSSSDEAVATVSTEGLVTAIKEGSVQITAASGEFQATCKLTVVLPIAPPEPPAPKNGWIYEEGQLRHYEDNEIKGNVWVKDDGKWRYANAQGLPQKGWLSDGGFWYYFGTDGFMKTGWQKDGGTWYLLADNGKMLTGWQRQGGAWYLLSDKGKMKTGWQKSGGAWYLLAGSGKMLSGWQKSEGNWYLLATSGKMLTGWQKSGGAWYLLASSGKMLTGWQKQGNVWYLLASSGKMQTGWQKSGGAWYLLAGSGKMLSGWQKQGNSWYLLAGNGKMLTGWQKQGATWYYLNPNTGIWDGRTQ